MKSLLKKLLTISLCICIMAGGTTVVSAAEKDNIESVNLQSMKNQMYERGYTEEEVKTLCHKGFSLEEQIEMSNEEISPYIKEKNNLSNLKASTITVTNVPDDMYGVETGTFLSGCGLVAGHFYNNNPGSVYTGNINAFANYVLNGKATYKYYFLYGEYDSGVGYHKGVDIKSNTSGTAVYSAHSGSVSRRAAYGAVIIYDGTYSHAYLHMTNITTSNNAVVGSKIGNQSNVGAGGEHLHYEVRKGNSTSLGNPNDTYFVTEIPYSLMAKNILNYPMKIQNKTE